MVVKEFIMVKFLFLKLFCILVMDVFGNFLRYFGKLSWYVNMVFCLRVFSVDLLFIMVFVRMYFLKIVLLFEFGFLLIELLLKMVGSKSIIV